MKRTEGPWRVVKPKDEDANYNQKQIHICAGLSPVGYLAAANGKALANARFIVLAVNNHNALVKTLEKTISHCHECGGTGTTYTMEDETDFGMPPGASAIYCPDCHEARELLSKIRAEQGEGDALD